MKAFTTRLIVALLTFAVGIAAVMAWLLYHRAPTERATFTESAIINRAAPNRQTSSSVDLRIREYDNDEALMSLENNTDNPIYVLYQETTRRRPAILTYNLERRRSARRAFEPADWEQFHVFYGWNAIAPHTAVLFTAHHRPDLMGQYRVGVDYLENAETARLASDVFNNRETFDAVLDRRDREIKQVWSEAFTIPVARRVTLSTNSTLRAVNELPAPGEHDVIENEDAAIGLLRSFGVGQIRYFYDHNREQYGSFDELVEGGRINATDTEYRGYRFRFTLSEDRRHYTVEATPIEYGVTGVYSFYKDETGPPHGADKQARQASINDPSIFDYDRWRDR